MPRTVFSPLTHRPTDQPTGDRAHSLRFGSNSRLLPAERGEHRHFSIPACLPDVVVVVVDVWARGAADRCGAVRSRYERPNKTKKCELHNTLRRFVSLHSPNSQRVKRRKIFCARLGWDGDDQAGGRDDRRRPVFSSFSLLADRTTERSRRREWVGARLFDCRLVHPHGLTHGYSHSQLIG